MENTHITLSNAIVNNLYALLKLAGDRGAFKFDEFGQVAGTIEALKQEIAANSTPAPIVVNSTRTTEEKDA